MDITTTKVTLFKNLVTTKPQGKPISLIDIINNIKNGNYSKIINKARELRKISEDNYKKYKTYNLLGFTLSVECKSRDKDQSADEKIINYNHLIQIDIDNIESDQIGIIKDRLSKDPHLFFVCNSPSNSGLKGCFNIESLSLEEHKNEETINLAYNEISNYFMQKYDVTIDQSVKDLFRIFLITDDPDLRFNLNATPFKFTSLENFNNKKHPLNKLLTNEKSYLSNEDVSKGETVLKLVKDKITHARKGEKHFTRLRMGKLLGGAIADGLITNDQYYETLSVVKTNSLQPEYAEKNFFQAVEYGKNFPLNKSNLMFQKSYSFKNSNSSPEYCVLSFCFWYETSKSTGARGEGNPIFNLVIDQMLLIEFLEDYGFCLISIEGVKSNEDQLVLIMNNIITKTTIKKIRNLITNGIFKKDLPYWISQNFTRKQLRKKMVSGIKHYISEPKIDALPIIEIKIKRDELESSFYFFINKLIEVQHDPN